MKMKLSLKKSIALLHAVMLPIMLIYCILFIGLHTEHQCSGKGCPICHQLQIAESIIKQCGETTAFFILGIIIVTLRKVIKTTDYNIRCYHTLITDKVRMDD